METKLIKELPLERLKEFFSEVDWGKWLRLCRGLAIFLAALIILSYTTDYVLHDKIVMNFGLNGFERLTPELPSLDSIIMARGVQLLISMFLIVIVITLIAMFSGKDLNFIKLLTLVAHSFIIVAIFTALQLPFIFQIPRTPYVIVDVSLENVTFQEANMIGITPEGRLQLSSDIVKASHARIFRAYPNATVPNWRVVEGKAGELLNRTVTYMNLTDVRWSSGGMEMNSTNLDLCTGNWSDVKYEGMLNRVPIRVSEEVSFHEYMLGIFSLLSTIGLAIFNTIGFKKLYQASLKATLIVGILLLLALFFFGGF